MDVKGKEKSSTLWCFNIVEFCAFRSSFGDEIRELAREEKERFIQQRGRVDSHRKLDV